MDGTSKKPTKLITITLIYIYIYIERERDSPENLTPQSTSQKKRAKNNEAGPAKKKRKRTINKENSESPVALLSIRSTRRFKEKR